MTQVVFELHPSFTVPIRALEQQPFELTESGWGEFEVNIKVRCISCRARKANAAPGIKRLAGGVAMWLIWTRTAVRSCTLRMTPRSRCLS